MYPSKSNNHHLKKYTIILLLSLYAALVWSKLHWQHNESYTNIGPKIVLLHQGPLGKKIMLYILYMEERNTHNPYICFPKNRTTTEAVPFLHLQHVMKNIVSCQRKICFFFMRFVFCSSFFPSDKTPIITRCNLLVGLPQYKLKYSQSLV